MDASGTAHVSQLRLVQVLSGHEDRVWCAAWSPTGTTLATCSGDKTVRLWARVDSGAAHQPGQTPPAPEDETPNWACVATLEELHNRTIRRVSWSPCGRLLASASFDGSVGIWERDGRSDDWACVATLEGHENEVKAACWSPCGQFLATCGRDKTVWVWDRATSDADFECAAVLQGHSADVKSVCWCPRSPGPGSEAPLLLSCSYDDSLRVWREQPGGDDWDCVQILPGAATAAKEAAAQARKTAQGGGATPMDEDSLATVAADAAIQAATASGGHGGTVWEAAWKQDGSRVASVSDDKSIKFWRWAPSATGQLGLVPDGQIADAHERSVFCVHWHSAGDMLATGGGDNAIRVWRVAAAPTDCESAKPAASLMCEARDAHSSDVNSVAWHPAGVYLASCSDDGDVKVWRC